MSEYCLAHYLAPIVPFITITIAHHPITPSPAPPQLSQPLGLSCSAWLPAYIFPRPDSHDEGCLLQPLSMPPPQGTSLGGNRKMAFLGYILLSHMFPARSWEECLWLWSRSSHVSQINPMISGVRYRCPFILHFLALNIRIANLPKAGK